jgi:FMN phosphatase YigB (HAD superfamily)
MKAFSFDVFDTALLRRVAAPSDVFRIVARRIAQETDIGDEAEFVESFLTARIEAERRCVSSSLTEECSLSDIWEMLHDILPALPIEARPHYELDAESEVIMANPRILQKIGKLREKNCKIIFISDTYLPHEFIQAQLEYHGLALAGDHCYVSSKIGLTKRSGNLFSLVLQAEQLRADQLVHVGDNRQGDIINPKKLGIKTTLCSDAALTRWERAITNHPSDRQAAGTTLALAMRSMRLQNAQVGPSSEVGSLVTTFLGPAIVAWAAWVLGTASRQGIRRLYFVARDGYLVWRAARIFSPEFGDIDCRYLKISRQSILLPSTTEISQAGMPWLHDPWETPELCRLLAKLGFAWDELAHAFKSFAGSDGEHKLLRSPDDWERFWEILRLPEISELIRERILARRRDTLGYLQQEALGDGVPAAIVDIGWRARGQSYLRQLLGSTCHGLRGYYLGLMINRPPEAETGLVNALFYELPSDRAQLNRGSVVFERINILEHVLGLAPHGTVSKHCVGGNGIEAVCAPASDSHIESVRRLTEALERFCVNCLPEVRRYSDRDVARAIIGTLIEVWCAQPSRESLHALREIAVSEDANGFGLRPLIQAWPLSQAFRHLLPYRWHRRLQVDLPIWPEAAVLDSGVGSRVLLQLRDIVDFTKEAIRTPKASRVAGSKLSPGA